MSAKKRQARTPAPKYTVAGGVITPEAHVWDGDKHIMTMATREGAERVAALLNDADRLADDHHLICGDADLAKNKIAYAVAKAMGGAIDFRSFQGGGK